MRATRKIFNPIFLRRVIVTGIMLAGMMHYSMASPVDTAYRVLIPVVKEDTVVQKHNYAANDFCNCSAPVVALREINTTGLEGHRTEKEFQYERTVKDEASSFWDGFWNWLSRRLFGKVSRDNAIKVRNIFYWLIAVFAILIVAFWLYKSEFFGRPMRGTTKINDGLFEETERSEEDIDEQIKAALRDHNYPLAIRWIYIKCIKALSMRNQIDIRKDKTNYDYYLELKNPNLKELFSQLTRLFEYTNYGDFTSTESNYQEADEIFNRINGKI